LDSAGEKHTLCPLKKGHLFLPYIARGAGGNSQGRQRRVAASNPKDLGMVVLLFELCHPQAAIEAATRRPLEIWYFIDIFQQH
jgi:hypothetical protein